MSFGSTAAMRAFGSAFQSVEVSPSLNFPYAGLRGRYLVTVKRRPQDFVPTDGAISVAARMLSWLRASAASAMLERIARSEEHTSELQSRFDLVCRLLLEKKQPT